MTLQEFMEDMLKDEAPRQTLMSDARWPDICGREVVAVQHNEYAAQHGLLYVRVVLDGGRGRHWEIRKGPDGLFALSRLLDIAHRCERDFEANGYKILKPFPPLARKSPTRAKLLGTLSVYESANDPADILSFNKMRSIPRPYNFVGKFHTVWASPTGLVTILPHTYTGPLHENKWPAWWRQSMDYARAILCVPKRKQGDWWWSDHLLDLLETPMEEVGGWEVDSMYAPKGTRVHFQWYERDEELLGKVIRQVRSRILSEF